MERGIVILTVCTRGLKRAIVHSLELCTQREMLLVGGTTLKITQTCPYYVSTVTITYSYSLKGNNIGTAGAQALAEGLQHCTSLQDLKQVICVNSACPWL